MRSRSALVVFGGIVITAAIALYVALRDADAPSAAARAHETDAAPSAETTSWQATPTAPTPARPELPREGTIPLGAAGERRQERAYREGVPHGRWTLWNADGTVEITADFEEGRLARVDGRPVKRALAARAATKVVRIFERAERAPVTDDATDPKAAFAERIAEVRSHVEACAHRTPGTPDTVTVRIVLDGEARVIEATARVSEEQRALGACIEDAIRAAVFPPAAAGMSVSYPVRLHDGGA